MCLLFRINTEIRTRNKNINSTFIAIIGRPPLSEFLLFSTEEHNEELILLLLGKNKFTGVYDSESKLYTKGTDVENYISFVMRKFVIVEQND